MALMTGPISGFPSGGTSEVYTTPFPVKVGTRGRDTSGNEYVFCDYTATVYDGVVVILTDTFTAAPLLGTANVPGAIGVVIASTATSDNGGWVQIYGLNIRVQTNNASDTSTSGVAGTQGLRAQTSVTTPSGTVGFVSDASTDGTHIYGMWIADTTKPYGVTDSSGPATNSSPTSGSTYHIGTEVACWLNYPYVTGQATELVT